MMKGLLAAVLALAFTSSALACSCLPPPPLSQCNVDEQEAAILVKVLNRKEFSCPATPTPFGTNAVSPPIFSFGGTAISTVKIIKVYDDNTDLDLESGDKIKVSTAIGGATCGYFMKKGEKHILFVRSTGKDKKLTQDKPAFIEENKCVLPTAPLSTSLCAGNVRNPTLAMKKEMRLGCKKAACRELLDDEPKVLPHTELAGKLAA